MNEDNNLEKLKRRLYERDRVFLGRGDRNVLRPKNDNAPSLDWQRLKKQNSERPNKNKFMKIIFYSFIIFLLIAIGLFFYFWFFGTNVISSENVVISARGPVYIDGGEESGFTFTVQNNNTVALESADLIFDFPSGSFSPDGEAMTRQRTNLGNIRAGESVNKNLNIIFFGLENEEKNIGIALEYRIAGSNAILAKNDSYAVKIAKASFGLSLSVPKEIASNKEVDVKVNIVSNSESTAKKLRLEMKYPPGFKFISAAPAPSEGENIWSLGDIGSSEERNVVIKGIVEGQNLEERTFVASVGAPDKSGVLNVYGVASEKIVIKRTPLNLSVFINGQNEDNNVVYQGESVRVDVEWVNNLSDYIRNAQIELEVTGNIHDERSISASKGFYRTSDKKIIWNSSGLNDLASIASGGSGRARLSFSIKDPLPVRNINDKNFSFNINAKISGLGTSDQFENKEISDSVAKKIKIASRLQSATSALYYSGPFENSGPLPPKVGAETTYTIVWSLANNSNDFSDVKITASLPPYVSWVNKTDPPDSDIKFDEKDLSLVWEAGDVPAGTGVAMPAKKIYFQVSFSPNLTQVGESPVLISAARLEGRDNFTEEILRAELPPLNTNLSNDPKTSHNDYQVVE